MITRVSLVAFVVSLAVLVDGTNTNLASNPLGGSAGSSQPLCYSHWQSVGPFHVTQSYPGIGNGLQDPEDIGAINEIWLTGNDTAYVGSVNGGVWKTTSLHSTATFGGPHWTPLTDQMPCLSIASISGSNTDADVVAAGCGFVSYSHSRGGEPRGVMLTKDGGSTWSMTIFPKGFDVTSLLVSGTGSTTNIVVAAKPLPTDYRSFYFSGSTGSPVDPFGVGSNAGGIWVSHDAGATFTQKYSTYPVGKLVRDPTTSTTIYAVAFAPFTSGSYGPSLLFSSNGGVDWLPFKDSPSIIDQCPRQTIISGVTFAASASRLYVGYSTTIPYSSDHHNDCHAVYYSDDLTGSSWTGVANVPRRNMGGPTNFPTNFAILAPPGVSNTLFVSGYGSRVWRVDTVAGVWTDIADTSINVIKTMADENGVTGTTASGTAPHANTRAFAWDTITNDLISCNDGGCYRRTSPLAAAGTGDWTTLSGDLSITEVYQAAYDPVSGAIILAAYGNSLMISQFDGTEKTSGIWNFLLGGSGFSVGVDTSTSPTSFYGGGRSLGGWLKVPVNGNSGFSGVNTVVHPFTGHIGTCYPGTDEWPCSDEATQPAVNRIQPSNVLVCASESCYNTTFPSNATQLEYQSRDWDLGGSSYAGIPMAYVFGGVKNGINNPSVIFAIGEGFVWSRDVDSCASSACMHSYSNSSCHGCLPGSMVRTSVPWKTMIYNVRSIAQHPTDYYINAIIDNAGHVWLTVDFGQTWTDIALPANSNLLSTSGHTTVDTMGTMAAIFVDKQVNGVSPLIIGTTYGSFVTFTAPAANANYTFVKLGANQPKTFVSSYTYSPANDVLVMSTFGRGIWTLQKASEILALAATGSDTTTINSDCTVPLYPNVPNAYGYISSGILPSPIGFPGPSSSISVGTSASDSTGADGSTSSTTDSIIIPVVSSSAGGSLDDDQPGNPSPVAPISDAMVSVAPKAPAAPIAGPPSSPPISTPTLSIAASVSIVAIEVTTPFGDRVLIEQDITSEVVVEAEVVDILTTDSSVYQPQAPFTTEERTKLQESEFIYPILIEPDEKLKTKSTPAVAKKTATTAPKLNQKSASMATATKRAATPSEPCT